MAVPVTFESDGVTLAGEQHAVSPHRGVALLLHGGGQTRHSWAGTARKLGDAGWSSIDFDARGHGDSGWSATGDYSLDAFVGDLAIVVDSLDEAPVLIGASLGGVTAMLAVGEQHVRARALVLVDVVPRVEAKGLERISAFMSANPDGFGSLEEVAAAIASYNPHRRRPPTIDGVRKNVRLGPDG